MDAQDYIGIILSIGGAISLLLAFWEKIFNSGKKDATLDNRVSELEKTVTKTSEDIDLIKNNHLAHMQSDINGINIKMERIETTLEFIKNK